MNIKNKIALWVEKYDRELHFLSGLGNIFKGVVALIVFVFGLALLIPKYIPSYAELYQSHFWTFFGSFIWFVITLTLLYAAYSSRVHKGVLMRLGASCAENMKSADTTYSERRRIVKKYAADFHLSKKLYILGATGLHTFAKAKDPMEDSDNSALLRPVLERLRNDRAAGESIGIDILLLHPDSEHLVDRVNQFSPPQAIDSYKKEIIASVEACREFKRDLPKLRCFVYDRPLIWKLIITDAFAWQQFYKSGTHAEHSRINIFSNFPDSGNALYHPFLKLFELLRDSASVEVDLTQERVNFPSINR